MSGNLWMFSDQLDDEDALMMQRDFLTYYQGADYYGLGLKVFTRLAHEAGAVYKLGKRVLVRRDIFEEYLRFLRAKEDAALEDASELYSPSKQGTLVCNADSGRFRIRFDVEEYSDFLFAGTILEVLYHGEWVLTRLDMIDTWVLEDIPTKEIPGLIVRI
mgnify:FL=1